MTKAFFFCFILGLFMIWVSLSIEHGKEVGKSLKQTLHDFFFGVKKKKRKNRREEINNEF